jgi:methylated-DNA-[protein]-cysteine S-methyltransferase
MQQNDTFLYHFSTPFGAAAIIYRESPFSILRLLLFSQRKKDRVKAAGKDPWSKPGFHQKALIVSDSIGDYFAGKPIKTPWEWLEMSGLTRLQQSVLTVTAETPYGTVRSYKAIAEAVDRPRAYRFVGTTLANNPFPILIPCHRIIKSDGSIGRFSGGADLKKRLLKREANHFK